MSDKEPTDLAVEIFNLTDLNADIPHAALMGVFALWQLDLRICQECGRAGGQHVGQCFVGGLCETCNTSPCSCDDWEAGE